MEIMKTVSLTFLLSVFAFVITPVPSHARQSNMIVEHYSLEQGLPNNIVYYSYKDNDGFLWFGTWYGLCSFDGVNFTSYTSFSKRTSDVPPRKIIEIAGGDHGHLWVRTVDNRLFVFNQLNETYKEVYEELKLLSQNVQVIKVQKSDRGHVLILTRNKNLFDGYVKSDGSIGVRLLCNAGRDINPYDMKLRRNILGETDEYLYWVGRDYTISAIHKPVKCRLLSSLNHLTFTGMNNDGKTLWVGASDGSTYHINPAKCAVKRYKFQNVNSAITSISCLNDILYFSSAEGVFSYSLYSGLHRLPVSAHDVISSYVDNDGNLWLFNGDNKLILYNTASGKTQTFTFNKERNISNLSFQDFGENGLFILLPSGDIWHYERSSQTMHNIREYSDFGIDNPEERFFHIDKDKDGILWISSTSKGVYKVCFPPNHFTFVHPEWFYRQAPFNDLQGVRALYQTRNRDIWVCTRWGDVYCLNENYTIKRFYHGTIGKVYNVFEDDQGRLWFSTKGNGLVKAEVDASSPQGLRLTRYTYDMNDVNTISSNNVYYTFQDSRRRIWVCTFGGGLNLIEEQESRTCFHHKYNGFRNYPQYGLYMDVRSISEDNNGRMWAATVDGLLSFNGDFDHIEDIRFETYRDKDNGGLLENDIYTLYKDSRGQIWISVFGGGLSRIKGYDENLHEPVLETRNGQEHLNNDFVSSIVEDDKHCLWLCTKSGLSSLGNRSEGMRNYGSIDGFPSVEIEDNTILRLHDGHIWVGTKQGVLSFSPSEINHRSNFHYKTFIVKFNVLNRDISDFNPPIISQSVRFTREITLSHDQSMFSIEYAALNFNNQEGVTYRYILEGYEHQWHYNGMNRIASYANVPHGDYVFRVQVVDESDGGVVSECSMDIKILPPWWATWWAYLIYVLLGIAFVYGAVRIALSFIRMRNETYVNDRLAELKLRFFTNVSHELRTPLTLIQSPIEELKKNESLSPVGRQYLDLMSKNARKMLQLVNQILDFRKIQNGKMRLHVSLVDVNEMLELSKQEFSMLAEEREISFIYRVPDEHVMMWCDGAKIGVVLRNLLSNAFKFTRKGGMIVVTLELVKENKVCRMSVSDDGVAIPKSQLDVIFERFSQADNTKDNTSYTGTGIGLSLSREYVNLHHGSIWAESGSESGAKFIVELPVDKEHFGAGEVDFYEGDHIPDELNGTGSVERDYEAPSRPDSSLSTLLLIEDNTDLCQMLKLQMSNLYNVIVANDGAEGMRKLYQCHPDIVVTDLMMPIMDGLEVLNRIRGDFSISHIPVIVLTAKSDEDDKMDAIRRGANAYITKPFSRDMLVACINQLISERRMFQEKMISLPASQIMAERKDNFEQHLERKDMEFIGHIHEVIENNLNETDFNIDSIASSLGLSRSAFFKKLKSLTGFAPVDLVKEIRLNKAVELIDNSDLSITEIAYRVGFKEPGYFGKCFRKKFNMTPTEYRNERQKS
jgi:signal transduction histidine kinase/DNA-binding response OmpR family regulator/ligand-binding sensor domain-containing protein